MDDDILEVGEDGVFEITTTKTVKQTPVVLPSYDHAGEFDDEMDSREELLDSINPGEYKIYNSKACIYIIMKMYEDESIIKVGTVSETVVIETSSSRKLSIPIKNLEPVNKKSGSCTVWKDYVTLKFSLA